MCIGVKYALIINVNYEVIHFSQLGVVRAVPHSRKYYQKTRFDVARYDVSVVLIALGSSKSADIQIWQD
jgi:hypothetical protein